MKTLFKNPKAALAYVGLTLVSVVLFVGTEDDPGSLQRTVGAFDDGQSGSRDAERRFGDSVLADPTGEGSSSAPTRDDDVIIEFASDEDLIDQAQGYDPTPHVEQPLLPDQDKPRSEDLGGGWSD